MMSERNKVMGTTEHAQARTYSASGTELKYKRQIAVRMKIVTFNWLKETALRNGRTLSSEVAYILENERLGRAR